MNILEIKNLHFGYGNEEVMSIKSALFPAKKVIGLLGPSAGGKSSLLLSIAKNNTSPSYWEKGEILIKGKNYNQKDAEAYIGMVPQKARLYTGTVLENFIDGLPIGSNWNIETQTKFMKRICQKLELWVVFENIIFEQAINQSMGVHKLILIAREVAMNPELLLLDEVLANTSVSDEEIIINLIKRLSGKMSILVITHSKTEAKAYCDVIALFSGGILHEITNSEQFFQSPVSDLGKRFLASGSAWYTNTHKSKVKQTQKAAALRKFSSVNEFFWIRGELLGGMQKPGLLTDIEADLKIMQSLHVVNLVSLTKLPIDKLLLKKYTINGFHYPIIDMSVPDLNATVTFLDSLLDVVKSESSIVFHCKAGMGRTGLMLACSLIHFWGYSAIKAIETIRKINYKYIQTDEQLNFVGLYEKHLKPSMVQIN